MKKRKVNPCFMVLVQHYGMAGGVLDYGVADIKEFFDTFKEANEYAKNLSLKTMKELTMPMVWVLECKITYQKLDDEIIAVISKEESE